MAKKAPGEPYCEGLSLVELINMFPDEDTARNCYEEQVWPQGTNCPYCGTFNVQTGIEHPTMTHRCRDCPNRRKFSVRTGTLLQSSKLPFRVLVIAIYLFTTGIKRMSSMKLHRDLSVTYKTAWYLAHRLRKASEMDTSVFTGPVDVDEAYFGGIEGDRLVARKHTQAAA
ncbi:MAG: hypothetical protein OXH02_09900 [Gemmatimonadetes bacterium]|nr:hypothetical protein [Gemmatimonadota bacterium]